MAESFAKNNNTPLIQLKKEIPVKNVDGTENCSRSIQRYTDVNVEVQGKVKRLRLLVTSLGNKTVILGYLWLRQENPDINWKKQTLQWRPEPPHRIKMLMPREPFEDIVDNSLVISVINGKLTNEAREAWMKTRMTHSQLFTLEDEKKKIKPAIEIVPKEFHKYLNTVFSEREVGTLPPQSKYDHKINLKPGFVPKRGVLFRQGPQQDQAT